VPLAGLDAHYARKVHRHRGGDVGNAELPCRDELAPGAATAEIVMRSQLGYTGEQARIQILQHKDFIDAKVEIFLKKGSQVWAKLGEFPIERQLLTR